MDLLNFLDNVLLELVIWSFTTHPHAEVNLGIIISIFTNMLVIDVIFCRYLLHMYMGRDNQFCPLFFAPKFFSCWVK